MGSSRQKTRHVLRDASGLRLAHTPGDATDCAFANKVEPMNTQTENRPYEGLLRRLNRGSVEKTFTPQTDLDWSKDTTDDEYAALYDNWSLFAGTGADRTFSRQDRINFAKYQQMNLMAFTGLVERYGIATLTRLYELDPSEDFQQYVGHFIKEELYHHMMFMRAIALIHGTMGELPPLPTRKIHVLMRLVFALLSVMPSRRLKVSLCATLFRFAEQVTMFANQVARQTVGRKESLVVQVWSFHALDEARHLAFDDLILEHFGLKGRWRWLLGLISLPLCIVLSLSIHANELWAARRLGLRVRLWSLPRLMKSTTAMFKRRVFSLLGTVLHDTTAKAPLGDSCT